MLLQKPLWTVNLYHFDTVGYTYYAMQFMIDIQCSEAPILTRYPHRVVPKTEVPHHLWLDSYVSIYSRIQLQG